EGGGVSKKTVASCSPARILAAISGGEPMNLRRAALPVLLLTALVPTARGQSNNQCDLPGEAPDVIVGDLVGTVRHGTIGGITAFSVGTTSCNVGTCWLNWISNTAEHPVIG